MPLIATRGVTLEMGDTERMGISGNIERWSSSGLVLFKYSQALVEDPATGHSSEEVTLHP